MTTLRRLVSASVLLLVSGCEVPPMIEATSTNTYLMESGATVESNDSRSISGMGEPAITHGALSRSVTRQLDGMLEEILASTLPEVASLHADLEVVAVGLVPPERLATNDSTLRNWGQAARDSYRANVDAIYDEAERRLEGLEEAANEAAEAQARTFAPPRSPLDTGATGDPALDTAVTTFAEVMDGAIGLREVDVRHQQDLSRQLDLFEVFSSFGAKSAAAIAAADPSADADAEAGMQGRILLFVGGDERLGAPRALLAFRSDANVPDSHRIVQVMRHRVMRGTSVVSDLGWRAAPAQGRPGSPKTEVLENFLIAPKVEPVIDRDSPSYAQLIDMRIVVDIQSAVLDADNAVLGGVDWRIEFQVSTKGALTWQLAGGRPKFDPYCAEVKRILNL